MNFNLDTSKELLQYIDEALEFYNDEKVRELDGERFDFDRTDRTYNYSIFHPTFRRAPDSSQAHADNILPEPGMLWKEAPDQSPSL